MSTPPLAGAPAAAPKRERGLGFAVAGGLGVTLLAVLLGAAYWVWFFGAQQSASPAELLPADTQVYLALAPTLSDIPEASQLGSTLREQLAIDDSQQVFDAAVRLLGVDYSNNLLTWVGGTMSVAVGGLGDSGALTAEELLRDGDVVFIIGSRNDPQAEVFIAKHLELRRVRGETIASSLRAGQTIYAQQGGGPSPIAAFALFEHYVIFANRPELIAAMVDRLGSREGELAAVPAFAAFSEGLTPRISGGRYSDGSAAAQAGTIALRELLLNLDRVYAP